MTVEELQTKRDALISEIAKANESLSSPSGSVTKRSVSELQKALAILDAEIARTSASAGTSTIGRFYTEEGL